MDAAPALPGPGRRRGGPAARLSAAVAAALLAVAGVLPCGDGASLSAASASSAWLAAEAEVRWQETHLRAGAARAVEAWEAPPPAPPAAALHGDRHPAAFWGAVAAMVLLFGAAFCYLVSLWRERGLLAHATTCLRSPKSAAAATALGAYLVTLVSLDLLIKREAERGGGAYHTSPMLVVPLVEFGKLMVSLALHAKTQWQSGSDKAALAEGDAPGHVWVGWANTLEVARLMLPVALLFGCNNLLNFLVLARVRLDAYAVWRNMSILFNALIWVWALQRRIEPHRWAAVALCMLGSCFNTLGPDGHILFDIGVLGVLLSALLSSSASVFNERAIKSTAAAHLSIDQLNIMLYGETLLLMLAGAIQYELRGFAKVDGRHPVHALADAIDTITRGTWLIIGMQVVLGLCVSRVLKHADAVAKTVVGSLRDVGVVFLAPFVVAATRFDAISVGSACLVGLAGMIYSMPAAAPQASLPPLVDEEDGLKTGKSSA